MNDVYDFVISEDANLSQKDLNFQKVCLELCNKGANPKDIVDAWNASHPEFESKMYLVNRILHNRSQNRGK